jgi:hypothetical protein
MRTLNYLPRNLTNGYRPIVPQRWHFIITLNLSDRRHFDSDHAAPAQLYRGNLSHSHWPGWRIPPVRRLIAIDSTPQIGTARRPLRPRSRAKVSAIGFGDEFEFEGRLVRCRPLTLTPDSAPGGSQIPETPLTKK